jgi:glycosyltransferase involved in cell wall biosynthesis
VAAFSTTRPVIAFVSDAQEFAGAEHYLVALAEGLRERYEFIVVVGDRASVETSTKAVRAGARVTAVAGLRRRPHPLAPLALLRRLRAIRPAIVHVNASDQGDGIAAFAIAPWVPAPVVATLHNVLPGRAAFREAVSRLMLHRPRQVIAVSDRLRSYLDGIGVPNVVVKNGLPPPKLDPRARERLALHRDDFVVGAIGRLHHQKGWDVLCRAAALVHETSPRVKFVIIGDGPERATLARTTACRHVRLAGYVADASSLLGAFDLLAIPSRYEGLGLVAIEAMLSGIPLVATEVAGLVEVVADCARVVPSEQEQALAGAIIELEADVDARRALAMRGHQRAQRLFTRERMATETAVVYESVLAPRTRPAARVGLSS